MVLQRNGVVVSPEVLSSEIYTPSLKGSLQSALISSARRHGQIAYIIYKPETLINEVSHGNPVIVLQNLGLSWFPLWHYAVVIGYDLNDGFVLLHSGLQPQKRESLRLFNSTWSRSKYWGLLVLPPSRAPATAEEGQFIEAIIGLEKAYNWQAAAQGYKTALKKWPYSKSALIGLGNCYYAMRRLDMAEMIFRDATNKFPSSGTAFNNLAQVLFEQGKQADALSAALKALEIGGSMKEVYQKTLEDIQGDLDYGKKGQYD
jgi:tetratricopeptide (TPR) repeat protein